MRMHRHNLARNRIVPVLQNTAIEQHCNSRLNNRKRQQEPFSRPEWLSESVHNFDVQSCIGEKSVHQALEFVGIKIDRIVSSDRMNRSHQKSRIVLRSANAVFK